MAEADNASTSAALAVRELVAAVRLPAAAEWAAAAAELEQKPSAAPADPHGLQTAQQLVRAADAADRARSEIGRALAGGLLAGQRSLAERTIVLLRAAAAELPLRLRALAAAQDPPPVAALPAITAGASGTGAYLAALATEINSRLDAAARTALTQLLRRAAHWAVPAPPGLLPLCRAGREAEASCPHAVEWTGPAYAVEPLWRAENPARGVSAAAAARFEIPLRVPLKPGGAPPGQAAEAPPICTEFATAAGRRRTSPPAPAPRAGYLSACEAAALSVLRSAAAESARALHKRYVDRRVAERVPLKAFIRVARARCRALLEEWRARLSVPAERRELAFAQFAEALVGEPVPAALLAKKAGDAGFEGRPSVPAWAFAAASAAYLESAALWGSLDRAQARDAAPAQRAGLDEAASRGSQVYSLAAQLAPVVRARWRDRAALAQILSASDPAVLASVRVDELVADMEVLLGDRRADLLQFRESFAEFVAKGQLAGLKS